MYCSRGGTATSSGRLSTFRPSPERAKGRGNCSSKELHENPGAGLPDERGGKSEIDLSLCFELSHGIIGKLDIYGTEVVEELVDPACADDWVDGR